MNIFSRIFNFFRGMLSMSVSDMERSNPAVAYENAINAMIKKLADAQNAVASIISNRRLAEERLKKAQDELAQVDADIEAAIATDQEDLGVLLLQKKDQLETTITTATSDLERLSGQAEDSKAMLTQFKGEIDRLRSERDENLARHKTAKAQIQINEQLSGMSVDSEIRALDNVREGIRNTVAKAELQTEMAGTDVDQRLKKLRQTSGEVSAKARFQALRNAKNESANKTL